MAARVVSMTDLDACMGEIAGAERVVIDTEFHPEKSYLPTLYLVQVHVPGGNTWILDPLVEGLVERAGEVLVQTPWLLHAGFQDLRLLLRLFGSVPEDVLDTQIAAGLVDVTYPAGLVRLLETWNDVTIPKTATLSDWSKRPLDAEQLRYAGDDVVALPALWDAIWERVVELGREEMVREACREARDQAVIAPPASELWRDLGIASSMTPSDAAILRPLVAWREDLAWRLNKPARFMLGEGALKMLARGRPGSRAALQANRRMPRSLVQRHGEELVSIIAEAAKTPEADWPAVVRPGTPAARVVDWLALFGDVHGSTNRYATRLVLPKRLREDLVLGQARNRGLIASILGPWRDRLIGDNLHRAMIGDIAVQLTAPELALDAAFPGPKT